MSYLAINRIVNRKIAKTLKIAPQFANIFPHFSPEPTGLKRVDYVTIHRVEQGKNSMFEEHRLRFIDQIGNPIQAFKVPKLLHTENIPLNTNPRWPFEEFGRITLFIEEIHGEKVLVIDNAEPVQRTIEKIGEESRRAFEKDLYNNLLPALIRHYQRTQKISKVGVAIKSNTTDAPTTLFTRLYQAGKFSDTLSMRNPIYSRFLGDKQQIMHHYATALPLNEHPFIKPVEEFLEMLSAI